jgi:hypothetical protein
LPSSRRNLLHAVVDGVAFDGFEAGAVDHFDDLLSVIFT